MHAPWGLALRALLREQHGIETHALWSDDGIILHLPDADALPPDELVAIDPDRIEDLVVGELGGSSLFGARFRESAARALLIPRRRPGQRTPLWQQRLRAQSLLAVAERYGSFPILLETYRELLADHFDLGALRELLAGLRDGSRQLVAVESQTASPFAASLNFEYVAQYLYEDDAPAAERRVAALTLDRDLLRELAGSDELRDLLDADARRAGRARSSAASAAAAPDALHDLLRRVGDLARGRARRAPAGRRRAGGRAELLADRRALRLRIGGEDRLIAAEDAGRYRDALGTMPPGGVPAAFLEPVPDALRSLVARYARWRGPFGAQLLAERYDLEPAVAERELVALERAGTLVRGALRPGGSGREWCDVEVLRRIRRASVARLRREVEAVEQPALARFALAWHGAGRKGRGGIDRLREVLFPLQRLPLAPEVWERQVLPLRMDYRPELLDQLCTSGELVWLGADAGRVAIAFREDAALLGPPPGTGAAAGRSRSGGRAGRAAGRAPPGRARRGDRPPRGRGHRGAVAPGGLGRGDQRRLGAAAPDAPRGGPAHARAARRARAGSTRRRLPPRGGRARALGADRAAVRSRDRRGAIAGARSPSCCSSATACSCAPPWSPRACPAGPPGLRRALGELETLGVSPARLPGGRARRRAARPAGRDRAPARAARARAGRIGDRARGERPGEPVRRRAALAGAGGRPGLARTPARSSCCATASRSAFAERGGRTLLSLQPLESADWARRRRSARRRRRSRAAPARFSSSASTASPRPRAPCADAFTAAGFAAGPRRLSLRARR